MKTTQPPASILGAIRNIGTGIYRRTAKFAGYSAASPTATTRVGTRIGTNSNSTFANIQRTGMALTAEMVTKDNSLAGAYLRVRNAYCRPTQWKPDTGDNGLNSKVSDYCKATWETMGVGCSMQDAAARTLHIETPVRGDAGLIFWRDGEDDLRLIEFSADQLGEVFAFTMPRACSLARNESGQLIETGGNDCVYFSGRYFRGADCVAYKIYERTNAWYANPRIYDAGDVIYCADPFNFRGMRGVTIFASVLQYMQKSEDMLQAALSAAQRQARTFGRVFNERGQPDEDSYENETDVAGRQTFFEKIPGGPLEEYYFNGDSAEFERPTAPGGDIISGVDCADQKFCIGVNMTYAFLVSGEKLGGAISRLDCNRCGKEIERIEDDISRPCLNRIAKVTILDAVRRGKLPGSANITRGHWTFTNLPTADAFRDSMDDIKSVRAGQDSDTRVIARYGSTHAEIIRDKENETFEKYAALSRVNKRLLDAGIGLSASIADIAQITDNPQQAAAAEQIDTGAGPTKQSARMAWDESKHPRGNKDNAGEFGPGGGGATKKEPRKPVPKTENKTSPTCDDRCQRARTAHVMVDKSIQRYAEEHNEPRVAKELGGVSFPDSEPIDIAIAGPDGVVKHGIELKTVVANSNAKITMKGDAIARKRSWERKNKATIHTVVVDDSAVFNANGEGQHDEGKRKIYYRRGYGSFRIGGMHQVKDMAELKALLDVPARKLPEGAK